jgi:hypothetical protein
MAIFFEHLLKIAGITKKRFINEYPLTALQIYNYGFWKKISLLSSAKYS